MSKQCAKINILTLKHHNIQYPSGEARKQGAVAGEMALWDANFTCGIPEAGMYRHELSPLPSGSKKLYQAAPSLLVTQMSPWAC